MALRSGLCLAVLLSRLLLRAYDSPGYEGTTVSDGGAIEGKAVDTAGLFNLGLIKTSRKVFQGFDQPGIVRLECSAHGWMRGWLYVTDSPYYAITPRDGTFVIGDVPPGQYTLVAWHSFSGPTETPVTVTAKNTVTLTPDLARR